MPIQISFSKMGLGRIGKQSKESGPKVPKKITLRKNSVRGRIPKEVILPMSMNRLSAKGNRPGLPPKRGGLPPKVKDLQSTDKMEA